MNWLPPASCDALTICAGLGGLRLSPVLAARLADSRLKKFQEILALKGFLRYQWLFLLAYRWGNNMVELHSWLSHQHSGLRTYVALQQMTNELAETDAEHRAVYRLLSSILDPFIASFDEEPLLAGIAETTFQRLLAVVRDADNAISLAPDQQIDALNRIAAVDLI